MAVEPRLCRIEESLGRAVECPHERCPFWESGGAVEGACAFERLDLSANPELGDLLLRVCDAIAAEAEDARARLRVSHRQVP